MDDPTLRSLLANLPGIRHACDLDLLLFFGRHPLALLTSEQLVSYLGYERDRVAKSLEGLIDAGLLLRSQNPTHAARLYTLEQGGGADGGLLASLLGFASSRRGRRDVMRLLQARTDPAAAGNVQRGGSLTPILAAA